MKTLYLIRHGKSSWKDMDMDDSQRPLNKRGLRDAPEMGRRLKKRGIKPDHILSSPAVRAYTTAKIIASKTGYDESAIGTDPEIYLATPPTLFDRIRTLDNGWDTVFILGHNPGFTQLANLLCSADIENVPTCGIVAIQFDISNWLKVRTDSGKMIFFDFPKNDA